MNSDLRALVFAEWVAPLPGERVLELGCGIGRLARELAVRGAHVTGIDTSETSLEQARLLNPGCEFLCADLRYFTPPAPFDAVAACGVLQWVEPLEEGLACARRCLKTDGRLAASFGGAGRSAPDPVALHHELARQGFREIEIDRVEGQIWVWARRGSD